MPNREKAALYPPFAEQITKLEAALAAAKLPFYLFMGVRTSEEQDELFTQGRTKPGPPCAHRGVVRPVGTCQRHPMGLTVTNAKGGQSYHNYCVAADFVLDGMIEKPGVQWSWELKSDLNADGRNDWMQLGALAETVGLEWAGKWVRFPEFPHVQNRYGLQLTEFIELHRQGGLPEVWKALDAIRAE